MGEIEKLDEICLVKDDIMAEQEVSEDLDQDLAGRKKLKTLMKYVW